MGVKRTVNQEVVFNKTVAGGKTASAGNRDIHIEFAGTDLDVFRFQSR